MWLKLAHFNEKCDVQYFEKTIVINVFELLCKLICFKKISVQQNLIKSSLNELTWSKQGILKFIPVSITTFCSLEVSALDEV